MPYQSTILLEQLYLLTETHLDKALRWQVLPPADLTRHPAPGVWSAAQCLEHLNHYGSYYLPVFRKAIDEGLQKGRAPEPEFRPGWLGERFCRMMQPGTRPMKAARFARPAAAPDPVWVLAAYIDQAEQLLHILQAAEKVSLERCRTPISIAPWLRLKLGDILHFYVLHQQRHILQAERSV